MHQKLVSVVFSLFFATLLVAQTNNTPVSINGETMLIGRVQYQTILNYFEDWKAEADTVQPDSAIVAQFKAIKQPYHILLFLGTWCPDSRHGVPPFMAVLNAAANPLLKLEIIGVTRDKEDPEGLAQKYHIERVPTFVILHEGKEIGRLIEFPEETFARDFLKIISSQNQ